MLKVWFLAASLLLFSAVGQASVANTYIAQVAAGANDGTSCANARAASFFNTSGNWGVGAAQIGAGTTVHICGTISSAAATTVLQFQGGGVTGNPVTLLWEAGAIIQAPYCGAGNCIDLNGQSHIIADGGTACGELTHWVKTTCNGTIQDSLAGTIGQTCPGGPCTQQLADTVGVAGIGSGLTDTDIEIRNLNFNMYVRSPGDTGLDGMSVVGIEFSGGAQSTNINVHNNVFIGMVKAFLVSLPVITGNLNNYQYHHNYSTDQCWAVGIGANSPNLTITNIQIHDNEVSNWNNWVGGSTECHANGFMLFNGNGGTIFSNGSIGDSSSLIYNNYLHGDLTGGLVASSPSGYISPQDNSINFIIFNNLVVSTCTGLNPSRTCGYLIYQLGPGGGGEQVYNNTLDGDGGAICLYAYGSTGNVISKNNIAVNCGFPYYNAVANGPNGFAWNPSNFNDVYNSSSGANFIANNQSPGGGTVLTLSQWQGTPFLQDINTITTNPQLTANYKLQISSPAIGLGSNLTSLGISALNTDLAGVARPPSGGGAWDAGVYQFVSSGAPGASLSPTTIAFDINVISIPSGSQTVTLTNTGTASLTITGVNFVGTNAGDFSQTNNCPGSLAAGAFCTITITYTPSVFGYENANLSVNDNATGSPHTAALSGFGANPAQVGVGRMLHRKF